LREASSAANVPAPIDYKGGRNSSSPANTSVLVDTLRVRCVH
jgi:hypothetical protein